MADSAGGPPSRLDALVAVAEVLCLKAEALANAATEAVGRQRPELTWFDCTLIGLALKIDSAFRALISDARERRAEAMHHLKTMVEAFIYFHVVAEDPSGQTAARVYAHIVNEKIKYLKANQATSDKIEEWQGFLADLDTGGVSLAPLANLAQAYGPGLGRWYTQSTSLRASLPISQIS